MFSLQKKSPHSTTRESQFILLGVRIGEWKTLLTKTVIGRNLIKRYMRSLTPRSPKLFSPLQDISLLSSCNVSNGCSLSPGPGDPGRQKQAIYLQWQKEFVKPGKSQSQVRTVFWTKQQHKLRSNSSWRTAILAEWSTRQKEDSITRRKQVDQREISFFLH